MSTMAYTPGLKRKSVSLIRKTRKLPLPGEVLMKVGDTVSPDTIVARTTLLGDPFIINLAIQFGVDPEDAAEYMIKEKGDLVKEGEPIALKKFLWTKKFVNSPITGTLEDVSKYSGQVVIRGQPISVEVKAYIPGTVIEVIGNEGLVIEGKPSAYIQGIFGIGGETHGDIMMVSDKPNDVVTVEKITPKCSGKVLVGGSMITGDALRRAVEVGANGVIIGGINDKEIIELLGYEIGVAITGDEEVGLTIIVTEGYGKMNMSTKTFEILKRFEGKMACINGATQIRAGVMRPEIIVPRDDVTLDIKSKEDESLDINEGMKAGTPVRIIREPYFGAMGHVVSLPVELQVVETESKVRVLKAELSDGRKVLVPRANVEIIEE